MYPLWWRSPDDRVQGCLRPELLSSSANCLTICSDMLVSCDVLDCSLRVHLVHACVQYCATLLFDDMYIIIIYLIFLRSWQYRARAYRSTNDLISLEAAVPHEVLLPGICVYPMH